MTDELKPVRCGCGGEAFAYNVVPNYAWWAVRCASCGIETTSYHTETEAIEAWNRAMGVDCGCGHHCDVCNEYNHESHYCPKWCEVIRETVADLKSQYPERTAKVIEHDGVVTIDGKKYHHMEYLCENCKKKVLGGDKYCSHCCAKLIWVEADDIPNEYFESGGR